MDVQATRELIEGNPGTGYRRIARLVDQGELVRLRRGAVRAADELTPEQRLRIEIEATARVINHGTWFSHRSAALLHGLPVLIYPDTRPEVVRTFGGHGSRSARLHARAANLAPDESAVLDALPVTSLARTVLDLARSLSFPQALMVVDSALQRGLDRDILLGALAPGRGSRMAERAINAGDPQSESGGESESRALMICAGLPLPELQVPIYTADGRFVARPDFLWRAKRVVGEYDGEGKYDNQFGVSTADAVRAEKKRQAALEAENYLVIRWGKDALRQPGELARRIRRALASRPWF
ncbi:MAG TPA: hypothetical protein PLF56_03245 [Micropruina sp.]|jgi:hypothetical protein|nr:hypothetical protein [Micropruina sp.]